MGYCGITRHAPAPSTGGARDEKGQERQPGHNGAWQSQGMLACCWLISPYHEASAIAAHSPLPAGDGDSYQCMAGAMGTHPRRVQQKQPEAKLLRHGHTSIHSTMVLSAGDCPGALPTPAAAAGALAALKNNYFAHTMYCTSATGVGGWGGFPRCTREHHL